MTNSDRVSYFIFEISSLMNIEMIDIIQLELIDDLIDITTRFVRDIASAGVFIDDKI